MNSNNLKQIFQQYIDNFETLNTKYEEYYKWAVCRDFPVLMKKTLESDKDAFWRNLYEAKKATYNIIDSYTQPFMGLVEFAKEDPEVVRKLLIDLYAPDGGDLKGQMEKIADFFKQSEELLDKYYPGSYLYKQNSHSVSALLFLNDPDNHYMYKATQSRAFADCVEFYDDWGMGDNIKLDVYYRMCDELVARIKECKELLDVDDSRYDKELNAKSRDIFADKERHLLAFDIIYCSTTHDLYSGVTYTKRDVKAKKAFIENKVKAEGLKKSFDKAKADMDALQEVKDYLVSMIAVGDKIEHKAYGTGVVKAFDGDKMMLSFEEKEGQYSFMTLVANGIISVDKPGFKEKIEEYKDIINKHDSIPRVLDYAAKALEPYEELL